MDLSRSDRLVNRPGGHERNTAPRRSGPVGIQLGKVTKLGDQPVRFAINPQYNLKNDRGLGEWSVAFTFTTLFPTF